MLWFSSFKENFRDIYKSNPVHLKDVYKQFQEQLLLKLKEDTREIYSAHEISHLPSSFDKLVLKSNCDKTYRKCLQNEPRAHFYHEKRKSLMQQELNSDLDKLQLCNEEIEEEVLRNHEDILILKKRIQNSNKKLMKELDKLALTAIG